MGIKIKISLCLANEVKNLSQVAAKAVTIAAIRQQVERIFEETSYAVLVYRVTRACTDRMKN